MRRAARTHAIETVGARLRAMMPWTEEGKAAAARAAAAETRAPAAATR
jgi:ketol-acid reductoisomerase